MRGGSVPQLRWAGASRLLLPAINSASGGASPWNTQRTLRIALRSGEPGADATPRSIQPSAFSSREGKGNKAGTFLPCSAIMSTVFTDRPSIRSSRSRCFGLSCHPSQSPKTTVYCPDPSARTR